MMSQPAPRGTQDVWPIIPAPRRDDRGSPAGLEMFSFVDIEHALVEEAELEAAADGWDGFL